jgi:hypothetical protein
MSAAGAVIGAPAHPWRPSRVGGHLVKGTDRMEAQ